MDEIDGALSQILNNQIFSSIDDPITGRSVAGDTPLIPIVPYSEPVAVPKTRNGRIEFLKQHYGDKMKIGLTDSSVHKGILQEVGPDYLVLTNAKYASVLMADIQSVVYIEVLYHHQ